MIRVIRVLLDRKPYQQGDTASRDHAHYAGHWFTVTETLDPPDLKPGQHTIDYEVSLALFGGRNLVLSADFEVVPADAVQQSALQSVEGFLEDWLMIRCMAQPVGPAGRMMRMALSLQVPVPTDLSFDVIAEIGDRELMLGTVKWAKGSMYTRERFDADLPGFDGDWINVILRSNSKTATVPTNDFAVWDGELRFGGVSLTGERSERDRKLFERMKQRVRQGPSGG